MSDSLSSSHAAPPSGGPLRIRLDDVPALFSEGPEPEAHESAKTWWPHVETQKLRAKMAWPSVVRAADGSLEAILAARHQDLSKLSAAAGR